MLRTLIGTKEREHIASPMADAGVNEIGKCHNQASSDLDNRSFIIIISSSSSLPLFLPLELELE